jgi:hypothetical protein
MVEYVYPNWEKEYSHNVKLSILLGVDSFSLSIADFKNVILAYHQYDWSAEENTLEDVLLLSNEIKNDALFNSAHHSFSYQVIPSVFSFLPTRLFNKDNLNIYLEHLSPKEGNVTARFGMLPELDLAIIYKLNFFQENLSRLLNPAILPAPVFNKILPFLRDQELYDTHIFCRISQKSLLIFVFRDNFFQFANQFYCNQLTDFQYYIMLVCAQFQLNPVLETVYIWGDCDDEDEVVINLKSLFSRVKFLHAQLIISSDGKTRIVSESKVLDHLI